MPLEPAQCTARELADSSFAPVTVRVEPGRSRGRPRVLLIAFACDPHLGSEPEVGWQWTRNIARTCDVWVLTDACHQAAMDAYLAVHPEPAIHMLYHRLPEPLRGLQRGAFTLNLYYYLWQVTAAPLVRRMHRRVGFDLSQHLTYVRYWMPSAGAAIDAPFVWGPVGGGESAPPCLRRRMRLRHRFLETARVAVRRVCEWDPLLRMTAGRCAAAIAVTAETAVRLRRLGVRHVEVVPAVGHVAGAAGAAVSTARGGGVRFVCIGRLLHWKGVDLAVRAFAAAGMPEAELLIIGDGPERQSLEALAGTLGIAGRTTFTGELPRARVGELLADSDALVHPSLHDSGGAVCIEAMAAGKPVICLDLGGPGTLVDERCGIKVPAGDLQQILAELAASMRRLECDAALRQRLGEAGREYVATKLTWAEKMRRLEGVYARALAAGRATAVGAQAKSDDVGWC